MIENKNGKKNANSYAKHNFHTVNQFEIMELNNTERVIMKRSLYPIIKNMEYYGIKEYKDFVKTMKKYKLSRTDIYNIMIEMGSLFKSKDIFKISNRQLSHSNADEKNTILTYYAFLKPLEMYMIFCNIIYKKHEKIKDKENFCSEILNEIRSIHITINETHSLNTSNQNNIDSSNSHNDNESEFFVEESESIESNFYQNDEFDFDSF